MIKEKVLKLIDDIYEDFDKFHNDLSNIIFDELGGQEQFNQLNKAEQLAIYTIFIAIKQLLNAINCYKSWFK